MADRAKRTPPKRSKDLVIDQELGVTNVMPVSTWINWNGGGPTPPGTVAIGRDPLAPSVDELVFMIRRDGQARAMLSLLTLPLRAAFAQSKWVTPDEEGGGKEEAEFANLMWNLPSMNGGMEVPASMFLRQALLALPYGFSAFNVVRHVPENGPLKGKLTIKKLAYRDPRTVTFLADDFGTYRGFKQITSFAGKAINVTIPEEDSWYFAANEEENPMYGVSYFESAFQHYQMKRKIYYIGHLAAQMAAVPGRIGELPQSATPKQILEFKAALSNFAFNTAMVAPFGFKVNPFNGNSNFDFIAIAAHHNMMMASSILAKFLQQEDRQVLIDNGKADASADMFVQMLEAIAAELSESWSTKLMPQFIDANFTSGVYPVHKFAPLTDENKQAILQLFETMVSQPVLNCTPEFFRQNEMKLAERLGYDIDWEEVAKEEEAAAKAQQEAQQAAEKAALQGQAQPQGSGGVSTQQPTPRKPKTGPSSAGPVVKASVEEQQAAMDQIFGALNVLMTEDDVPADFALEPEIIPEAQE